jgi:hypothetical protein
VVGGREVIQVAIRGDDVACRNVLEKDRGAKKIGNATLCAMIDRRLTVDSFRQP